MHSRASRPAFWLIAAAVAIAAGVLVPTTVIASAGAAESTKDKTVQRFEPEHWATITRTPEGYYYDAGQQNTHLVVTEVKRGLRFADRNTNVLRHKPDSCNRKKAKVGLVVICRVPGDISTSNPFRVKVFTRLGNDYVNTRALRPAFRLYGLADKGDDTFIGGPGNDFINGAPGRDHLRGGSGNDWIRGGKQHDVLLGGGGNDQLVGQDGADRVRGSSGKDRVGGGPGDDKLYAGENTDFVLCHSGFDRVNAQREDRVTLAECERVEYA
ncbi:MAG TPA: calcium-binding protein [Actinomycetes bacterium]|nr:calcium-binding protein [Actinomycetes bacterium]